MKVKRGFTLVEILITVVVLGILAATVVPQFKPVGTQASTSRLCSDLQVIRLAIEFYKIQHKDDLPGAGTATFIQAMTGQTNINGAVGTDYGPYIQKVPINPFNDLETVEIEAGSTNLGSSTHGWHFNSVTGAFHADTDDHTGL